MGTGKGTSVLEMVRAFELAAGKVIGLCFYFWSDTIILAVNFGAIYSNLLFTLRRFFVFLFSLFFPSGEGMLEFF